MSKPENFQDQVTKKVSRRNVLKAAVAAGGATVLGFPMISRGQTGPVTMRWQSTWPTKDIFHEFALDFAKKVVDMTGGDLKIEVLPAGAVVPAFGVLDAVSKGTLDGAHGVLSYHYGKSNALALWGSSPAYGMDANMILAWHKYGGGKDLLNKIYSSLGANVVSFPYGLRRWIGGSSMPLSSTTRPRTVPSVLPTSRRSACYKVTTRTPSSSRSCSTRRNSMRCPTR